MPMFGQQPQGASMFGGGAQGGMNPLIMAILANGLGGMQGQGGGAPPGGPIMPPGGPGQGGPMPGGQAMPPRPPMPGGMGGGMAPPQGAPMQMPQIGGGAGGMASAFQNGANAVNGPMSGLNSALQGPGGSVDPAAFGALQHQLGAAPMQMQQTLASPQMPGSLSPLPTQFGGGIDSTGANPQASGAPSGGLPPGMTMQQYLAMIGGQGAPGAGGP